MKFDPTIQEFDLQVEEQDLQKYEQNMHGSLVENCVVAQAAKRMFDDANCEVGFTCLSIVDDDGKEHLFFCADATRITSPATVLSMKLDAQTREKIMKNLPATLHFTRKISSA